MLKSASRRHLAPTEAPFGARSHSLTAVVLYGAFGARTLIGSRNSVRTRIVSSVAADREVAVCEATCERMPNADSVLRLQWSNV